jgi:hypothetical protein
LWLGCCVSFIVQVLVDVWQQFVQQYPASLEAAAAAAGNSSGLLEHATLADVHSRQWQQQLLQDRYGSQRA